jgi:hypothetical protein
MLQIIQPFITNIEQECKLFTSTDLNITSGYEWLLRADIKSRAQWISSMVYCGVMSRNEAPV